MLRPAREADLKCLPDIQIASRGAFYALHHAEVLARPVMSEPLLRRTVSEGGAIVAVAGARLVGFGACERIEGMSHIHQMSVMPEHARRGIGSGILSGLIDVARGRGDESLTLITYADVSWNRPFYERHGFVEITHERAPAHLSSLLAEERRVGIDLSRRIMMLCALRAGSVNR